MRDSKPRVVEGEILGQVSEEVLVDPMRNSEVVRPVEVVDEEVGHMTDESACTEMDWVELTGVTAERCDVVLDVVVKNETPVVEEISKRILPELQE